MAANQSSSVAPLSSVLFSCRIVDIYSTLVPPIIDIDVSYSEFSSSPIKKVPIIRIFGSTPAGQKCCVHVHGAFPYLYVPCTTDNPSDRYVTQLGQSIDHALSVSLGSPSDEHHVFKISIVTGILSDLLLSSAIMNISFQPHESHIPFPLQFMIDYNLFGMNYIHTSQVKFRVRGEFYKLKHSHHQTSSSDPLPPLSPSTSLLSSSSASSVLVQPSSKLWNIDTLPNDMLTVDDRVSSTELEVDVLAADILNREEIEPTSGRFPGLVALWEEEQTRREMLGLEVPLSQPLSPDRICSLVHAAERRFKDQLEDIVGPLSDTTGPSSISSSPVSSFPLSQSCEVEVHEPLKSPPIKLEKHNNDVIVDEQLVHRKNEIQEKLSRATLDTSDSELLELLTELAGQSSSPPPVSPLSPNIPSQTILSEVLHSVKRSSSRTSDTSSVVNGNPPHEISLPLTNEDDRGGDTSSVLSSSILDDSIPCNQYVGDRDTEVQPGIDWLNRSSRSHTPVILDESAINQSAHELPSTLYPPTRQLSFKEKQQLVRLCSDISNVDDEVVQVEENVLEDYDDIEVESMMMSQVDWNENETEQEHDDFIPQLDGPGDKPIKKNDTQQRLSLKSRTAAARRIRRQSKQSLSGQHLTLPSSSLMEVESSSTSRSQTPVAVDSPTDEHTKTPNPSHIQIKRALSGSFVPLVRKLSKEDTERYRPGTNPNDTDGIPTQFTDTPTDTPTTAVQCSNHDKLSTIPSITTSSSSKALSSSTPVYRRPKRRRCTPVSPVKHSLRSRVCISFAPLNDVPLRRAIAESLKTYKREMTTRTVDSSESGDEDQSVSGGIMCSSPLPDDVVTTSNLPLECTSEYENDDDDMECSQVNISGSTLDTSDHEDDDGKFQLRFIATDSEDESEIDRKNNKFRLLMSTSESEGSECDSGTHQEDYSTSTSSIHPDGHCGESGGESHSKVKGSVHWNDIREVVGLEIPLETGSLEEGGQGLQGGTGGGLEATGRVTGGLGVSTNTLQPLDTLITPAKPPPTAERLMETARSIHGIPSTRNKKAFYSNPKDVQPPRDFGGAMFWVPSSMTYDLKEFSPVYESSLPECNSLNHWRTVFAMSHAPMGHTQDKGPPACHPDTRNGKSRHNLYTAADHESDVNARAQFMSSLSPCVITPVKQPPHPLMVEGWMTDQYGRTPQVRNLSDSNSLLEGPSLNNTYGFKITPLANADTHVDVNAQYITTMSIELHIRTRLGLRPDPEWDPVMIIFYSIINDWEPDNMIEGLIAIDLNNCCSNLSNSPVKQKRKSPVKKSPGRKSPAKPSPKKSHQQRSSRLAPTVSLKNFIVAASDQSSSSSGVGHQRKDSDMSHKYLDRCGLSTDLSITYVKDESELLDEFVKLVQKFDPDFLVGYEVELSSLGYLRDRASCLGVNLLGQLARIPSSSKTQGSRTATNRGTEPHVIGRIVLNLWRIVKHELSLTSYTFENVTFHALHRRLPKFTHETLTEWYEHFNRLYRYRVIDYYTIRCRGNHLLIDKFNLIGRTSEMSRLYGIEFRNCLSRGSQYRVESMMLRLAKPANYIAISPSVYQRAKMAAPECLPLILEPESKFYSDPVLVLDFQSLYPSMIIGYNYCYSTCLGRVKHLGRCDSGYPFGTCSLSISTDELKKLKNDITISPNGIVFLKPHVREGILPRMLTEILDTRIMVKQSMKLHKDNKALLKILDARQLSLKLIANVTYGYTGASYSGRMPCAEIADSIVRKGRETLERAIDLIHSNPTWNAKVVYGDTDSVFVLLKGVSKDEAFRIGNEMCKAITKDNPKPIKLKFEKVYLPCLLQTKKRYVGYSYESPDQKDPVYDAKGIETVRRDGCPAVGKILEKSLRLLFTTYDLSLVKSYVQRQFTKIMKMQISLQDFTFAKEYRGKEGYRPGACVPALELARQGMSVDRCSEPRTGERVPYVIVCGSPGVPLIELVRRPEELLTNPSLRLNAVYYITKQILPALDRALVVMGVDVFQWYNELPRVNRPSISLFHPLRASSHKNTIGQYFSSIHCVICDEISSDSLCKECLKNPRNVVMTLSTNLHNAQHKYRTISQICENCCGYSDDTYYLECVSLDCPVIYTRQTCLNYLYRNNINHSLIDKI